MIFIDEHIITLETVANKCNNNYTIKARLNQWYKIKEDSMKQQEIENKMDKLEKMLQDMSDKFDKQIDNAKQEIKEVFEEIKKEI